MNAPSSKRKSTKTQPARSPDTAAATCGMTRAQEHISMAAYYKAVARGFCQGGEMEDWLQAEAEYHAHAGKTL